MSDELRSYLNRTTAPWRGEVVDDYIPGQNSADGSGPPIGWRPEPPSEPVGEPAIEGEEEEPVEILSDGSPIGDLAGGAVASWAAAGWGRTPMVAPQDLEQDDEITTPGDFAAAAYANAAQIRAEYGMTPREYLEAFANASPEAWAETGLPADAKPMTARDLVERAYAAAGAEGMNPDRWLAWAATCPRDEWEAACAESGWDPAARPGFVDIPASARSAAIQRDIDEAVAAAKAGIRRPL